MSSNTSTLLCLKVKTIKKGKINSKFKRYLTVTIKFENYLRLPLKCRRHTLIIYVTKE